MERNHKCPNNGLDYQKYDYAAFAKKENKMIMKEYMKEYGTLEYIRKVAYKNMKQIQEEFERDINEIITKANVPRWKARIYFYYSRETSKFLYFREKRLKENSEDKCITSMDWQELYEILGPLPYFGNVLDVITKILEYISFLEKKEEEISPCIFEEDFIFSNAYAIPDFSVLEDKEISIIEEAIKKYLLTELPENSIISLKIFEKLKSYLIREDLIRGGFSEYVERVEEYRKILRVKTEFSYSNKK